jgi:glutathione-regulated potassium-efflux system ancillary protein KefF
VILILYAHPYPSRSRVCKAHIDAVRDLPGVEIRSLYDLYPDFDIDIASEQAALTRASLVVWLHPIQWYSAPGLLKHWFDKVLTHGWAYGREGKALHGKRCLWLASVGGAEHTYAEGHTNLRPFADYVGPIEQTARYCGMHWESPHLVFDAYEISQEKLDRRASEWRERLIAWQRKHPAAEGQTS